MGESQLSGGPGDDHKTNQEGKPGKDGAVSVFCDGQDAKDGTGDTEEWDGWGGQRKTDENSEGHHHDEQQCEEGSPAPFLGFGDELDVHFRFLLSPEEMALSPRQAPQQEAGRLAGLLQRSVNWIPTWDLR